MAKGVAVSLASVVVELEVCVVRAVTDVTCDVATVVGEIELGDVFTGVPAYGMFASDLLAASSFRTTPRTTAQAITMKTKSPVVG
jgi:hypothetical protein